MCPKCVVFIGVAWTYLMCLVGTHKAQQYVFHNDWLPNTYYPHDPFVYSNVYRTPIPRYSRPVRQSFFPTDQAASSPEQPFRFASSNSDGISSRSKSESSQWAYDLPHPLINETLNDFSDDRGPVGSQRRPKLTAGFAHDLGLHLQPSDVTTRPSKDTSNNDYRLSRLHNFKDDESSRGLSPEALARITETLGAINTVGRYLVNYTKGAASPTDLFTNENTHASPQKGEDLPKAIYTISKNVLGRNMTDTIAPIVKGALPPLVTLTSGKVVVPESNEAGSRPCTTPDGIAGNCEDLSNCPQLLLNLSHLRQSICFKSLFVPGVCCPRKGNHDQASLVEKPKPDPVIIITSTTTRRPLLLTTSNKIPVPKPTSPTPLTSRNEDCGQPQMEKFRVVGGDESLPGRWPWMAAIFLHGPRRTEFWCGGALIGPKHILTAAHCTRDSRQRPFNAHQFTVRLGDIDLRREDEPSSPETYYVSEVRAHPQFSRVGFYNDIAVLVLDRKVRRNRYTIPLCLPPVSLVPEKFVGQKPTVVGWGTTYYGGKESAIQRQVDLPVWKNEDCDRTYFQPITENFICAGLKEGGKDACQGDSGGPLMLKKDGRWLQIGIVSFGNKCGEPGYPGVYTRVTQYLDWIQENLV